MKIGDSVKVVEGVIDPELDWFDISGWQGRIINLDMDDEDGCWVGIAWDSITLKQMPRKFIAMLTEKEEDFSVMYLKGEEVEVTEPRDKETDVITAIKDINESYCYKSREQHEKNIEAILGEKDLSMTDKHQYIYFDYVKKNIQTPCILTGAENRMPGHNYLFDKSNDIALRKFDKAKPYVTDHFEFIAFGDKLRTNDSIMVEVKRTSDKKRFNLPLCELEALDVKSKNHELLSDYSFWITLYG